MKKLRKVIGYLLLALIVGVPLLLYALHKKEPVGIESPEVEQITQTIYANLDKAAWDSTQWVKWRYRGGRQYLWDKRNNRVQVRWDDQEVVLDLATQQGAVKKGGVLLGGEAASKLTKKAYKMFCNDSFWLAAPFKLTDPGTRRTLVTMADGRKGLKVTYANGGVTPGDSYVWLLDAHGIPSIFRMWVSILPIGGIEATWDQWKVLPTGAKIATFHRVGGAFDSALTDVDGGMGTPDF